MPPTQIVPRSSAPVMGIKAGMFKPPELTYFFEREDGTTFCEEGRAAWHIYAGRQQILGHQRPRIKFLGRSSGQTYMRFFQEAQEISRTTGVEAAQEHLRKGLAAELEEARKHMIPPPNYDKVDFRGNPTNITI